MALAPTENIGLAVSMRRSVTNLNMGGAFRIDCAECRGAEKPKGADMPPYETIAYCV